MAIGFSDRFDFTSILGWELYQVTIDKYHIMFWFNDERDLLDVADRFSFCSSDNETSFTYQLYENNRFINVDRILRVKIVDVRIFSKDQLDLVFRVKIVDVRIFSKDQLDLVFANGDILSVYDNPEFRSWWFLGGRRLDPPSQKTEWSLQIGDCDPEDLTEAERDNRRS